VSGKVGKIFSKAEEIKFRIIDDFAEDISDETNFYDVGYMQSQINTIKNELNRISHDIEISLEVSKTSDYEKERRQQLLTERQELLGYMIFLASNSLANIDECIKMCEGYNFIFLSIVKALNEYRLGNKDKAFMMMEKFIEENGRVEEHFLANKVFGLLLTERDLYKRAIPFLQYALQFIPDDVECLKTLNLCYKSTGENSKQKVVEEIISMLS